MNNRFARFNPIGRAAGAVGVTLLAACGGTTWRVPGERGHDRLAAVRETTVAAVPPRPGESVRVGGDLAAEATGRDGDYRSGSLRIDTPLPKGYPRPTPPGAIELKTYPAARQAEVVTRGNPDSTMNGAFWSLFNHIKAHEISMTSPVEMDYDAPGRGVRGEAEWRMAFLYRSPEMHRVGSEGVVTVKDVGPVTVVAVGMKGNYSMGLVERGMEQIEAWLAGHPEWKPAGTWRSHYYNGPKLAWWNKWAEVQLPVTRVPMPAGVDGVTARGGQTEGAR